MVEIWNNNNEKAANFSELKFSGKLGPEPFL